MVTLLLDSEYWLKSRAASVPDTDSLLTHEESQCQQKKNSSWGPQKQSLRPAPAFLTIFECVAGISTPSKTQNHAILSKKGTDSGRIPGDLPGQGTGAPWAPLLLRAAHHNCEQFGPCHLDAGRAGCRPGAPTWQARDRALAALPRQVFSGTGGLIFVDSGLAMAHLPTLCFALTHLTRARFRLELAQRPTTWWWWWVGVADALPALWWAS